MAVYYDNTSLKAKHERKRSLEELTKENKELKTRLQATEEDLTNTQVALTEVYEMLAGGGEWLRYMPPSSARASRPWMMSPPTCVTLLPSCWRRAPMRELRLRLALFLLRKEVQDMAVVYATLIIKGRKTIDQVPALLRKQVEEILADLEVEV